MVVVDLHLQLDGGIEAKNMPHPNNLGDGEKVRMSHGDQIFGTNDLIQAGFRFFHSTTPVA